MASYNADSGQRVQRRERGVLPRPAVFAPLLAGAGVAVALGVYGQVHDPTGRGLYTVFFIETARLKSWLATAAASGAATQLGIAALLWRRVGRRPSPRLGAKSAAHRRVPARPLIAAGPAGDHSPWGFGFQAHSAGTMLHSLAGCAFFGAYAAGAVSADRPGLPGASRLTVLAAGAAVFTTMTAVWWTGARWYFTNVSWGL